MPAHPRRWEYGKAKFTPPAVGMAGFEATLRAPADAAPSALDLRLGEQAMREHDLKCTVDELNMRLRQSQARIETQVQALDRAAVEAEHRIKAERQAEALRHRCEALEAELFVCGRRVAELSRAVESRDSAWSQHTSLEGELQATEASARDAAEAHQRALDQLRGELTQSQAETQQARAATEEAQAQARQWREALSVAEERARRLDARMVAMASEMEHLEDRVATQSTREREWRAERSKLLQEVDRNTHSAILRREELYFTRTNLLKENLRLRGEVCVRARVRACVRMCARVRRSVRVRVRRSVRVRARGLVAIQVATWLPYGCHMVAIWLPFIDLVRWFDSRLAWSCAQVERKPYPEPRPTAEPPHRGWRPWEQSGMPAEDGGGPPPQQSPPKSRGAAGGGASQRGASASPRAERIRTPTARMPEPPPPTFVHGLSPRAPRSVDQPHAFKDELMAEYRAASRAAAYGGGRPGSPPDPALEQALRHGERVAPGVGVRHPLQGNVPR